MIKIDDKGHVTIEGYAKDLLAQWATLSYAITKELGATELVTKAFAAGVALNDMTDEDMKKIGIDEKEIAEMNKVMEEGHKMKEEELFKKMFGDLMHE